MNRDYFTKPIQDNGRSAHDYGHTRLTPEAKRYNAIGGWLYILPPIIGYVIWQFSR